MVSYPAASMYGTAATLYSDWVDASLTANQRMARIARVWIDETLGAQQDMAELVKRSVSQAQRTFADDGDSATPMTYLSRVGDAARINASLWTEAGLKTQERLTRVAQTAFEELRLAGSEITERVQSSYAAR